MTTARSESDIDQLLIDIVVSQPIRGHSVNTYHNGSDVVGALMVDIVYVDIVMEYRHSYILVLPNIVQNANAL